MHTKEIIGAFSHLLNMDNALQFPPLTLSCGIVQVFQPLIRVSVRPEHVETIKLFDSALCLVR